MTYNIPVGNEKRFVESEFAIGEEAIFKVNDKRVIVKGVYPFFENHGVEGFWYIVQYVHPPKTTIYIGNKNLSKINKFTFNETNSAN